MNQKWTIFCKLIETWQMDQHRQLDRASQFGVRSAKWPVPSKVGTRSGRVEWWWWQLAGCGHGMARTFNCWKGVEEGECGHWDGV